MGGGGASQHGFKKEIWERKRGGIALSDAGMALTESLMKVRGDDWLGTHSDEVSHGDSCRGDLSLARTQSNSSHISNWLQDGSQEVLPIYGCNIRYPSGLNRTASTRSRRRGGGKGRGEGNSRPKGGERERRG